MVYRLVSWVVFGLILLGSGAGHGVASEVASSDDVRLMDPLSQIMRAPGIPEDSIFASFDKSESVDLVTGSQVIEHLSAPVYPLDGGRELRFARVFNSKNIRKDSVEQACDPDLPDACGALSFAVGDYWSGRGWTSHFGRVFFRSLQQGCETAPSCAAPGGITYYGGRLLSFEDSQGTQYSIDGFGTGSFGIRHDHPRLRVRYFHAGGGCPGPVAGLDDVECLQAASGDPAHFEVTYPDGTRYQLEHLVPEVIENGSTSCGGILDYIANSDRAGWYTTKITDVFGNETSISYAESGPFPEAITGVDYTYADSGSSTISITMDLWEQGEAQFPGNVGRLKTVHAPGFAGATVSYDFEYGEFGYLESVTLPAPAAGAARPVVEYGYRSPGPSPIFSFVDRIEYPTGGVTRYTGGMFTAGEYTQCTGTKRHACVTASFDPPTCTLQAGDVFQLCMEACANTRMGIHRKERGILTRTVWPDGDDDPANPNYTWVWDRFHGHNYAGAFPLDDAAPTNHHGPETNIFRLTEPDGRYAQSKIIGKLWPENAEDFASDPHYYNASYGRTKETVFFDSTGNEGRQEDYTYYLTPDEEIAILQKTETTYLDDDGTCFQSGGTAGPPRKMIRRSELLNDWLQFGMQIVEGDYLKPQDRHVSYKRYESTNGAIPPTQGRQDNHIVGVYDHAYVEQGGRRVETESVFDDNGKMTQLRREQAYPTVAAQTTFDGNGNPTPVVDDHSGTNDVLVDFARSPEGNPQSTVFSGGDIAPMESGPKTYQMNYENEMGRPVRAKWGVAGNLFPYYVADVGMDSSGSGLVDQATDPNGLISNFDYDGLGRLTAIDPPGGAEYATRMIYPSLTETRVIRSPGVEDAHDPANADQIYSESHYDGLGRLTERRNAMPDETLSVQIVRYDDMGRIIFESEWMTESAYESAATVDWTRGNYTVSVPLAPGTSRPWGTVTYYGTAGSHPLDAVPDVLGRVRRIVKADDAEVQKNYCGPHEEVVVKDVQTQLGLDDAITRFYHDGLGRLVVVDSPADGADAQYDYDVNGKLTRVNLVEDAALPSDPFEAWRVDSFPVGQERRFLYDSLGHLRERTQPEDGTVEYTGYDALGNLLAYQDEQGSADGYFFKNTYDDAGRSTRVERIGGTPGTPAPAEVDRLAQSGVSGEFDDLSGWTEGAILVGDPGKPFDPDDSEWKLAAYSSLPCVDPPPSGGGTSALYFGTGCKYSHIGTDAHTIQAEIANVTHGDVLTFKYHRSVRQGSGDKDRFSVLVVDALDAGPDDQTEERRILLTLDESQASFDRWRQTPAIRISDFFTEAEWPAGSTKDIQLYLVFEKGDSEVVGLGTGIFIDDLFVGSPGVEVLAEYVFDEDACLPGPDDAAEACAPAVEPANRFYGQLSHAKSYEDGRLVSQRSQVYKGLNGRVSGQRILVDWTGVEDADDWIVRSTYDGHGLLSYREGPYQPGGEEPLEYDYAFRRGLLDTITGVHGTATVPLVDQMDYSAAGSLVKTQFANEARSITTPDARYRPSSMEVEANDLSGSGTVTLWDSETYGYDGAGNITSIGAQQFDYDLHSRLVSARVHGQAQELATVYDAAYTYDEFGNLQSRTHAGGTPPPGFTFTHTHGNNRISEPGFAYDLNGNATRLADYDVFTGVAATWDPRNRMTAFFWQPPEEQGAPRERYRYDASGYRVVRYPEAGDGRPVISIRDDAGQLLAQEVQNPEDTDPTLLKAFVRGGGQLLVEREVTGPAPTLTSNASFYTQNGYGFDVLGGKPGEEYTVDIRTESGYSRQASGLVLDAAGSLWVAESLLALGETNFVRVKREPDEVASYSSPVALTIDPNVLPSDENQIHKMSVSRVGGDVIIRWKQLSLNGSGIKIYYDRGDGGGTKVLTPLALPPGSEEYTFPQQSLPVDCVTVSGTQTSMSGESGASLGVELPPFGGIQDLALNQPACDEPDPPGTTMYALADAYHHRDHLGNLRVVTDAAGARVSAHDYYPFGTELTSAADPDTTGGSRMRFTGHERDQDTQLDYMLARFYGANLGRFLGVDPISLQPDRMLDPQQLNLYSYVANNPLLLVDPTGEDANDFANRIDEKAEIASSHYDQMRGSAADQNDGSVGGVLVDAATTTVADIADGLVSAGQGLADATLRIGVSTGEAVGEGAGAGEIALAVGKDSLRLATTAAIGAGVAKSTAGKALAGAAETTAVSTTNKVLGTNVGRKLIGKGGVLNRGERLRFGFGRNGGRGTLRMGGRLVERITGKKHIDLLDLGKL